MKTRRTKGQTRLALTGRGILRALAQNRDILQRHAVRTIGLFSSFAHGAPTASSDIDFLVEFEHPTYDNFVGLERDLEKLFGRKVEILTPPGLESIRVRAVAESIKSALA